MIDQTLFFYAGIAIVSLIGFALFAWWWWKLGRASYMFKYLTFLFLSEGVMFAVDARVRYAKVVGNMEHYMAYFDAWWWPVRLYVPFLTVSIIVGHISYRAFYLRHRVIRIEGSLSEIETVHYPDKDLTVHTVSGVLTYPKIKDKLDEHLQGPIAKNALWDCTDADITYITTKEFEKVAQFVQTFHMRRKGGRTALVIPMNPGYRLGRMFESLAEIEGLAIEYQTFKTIKEAKEWLDAENSKA